MKLNTLQNPEHLDLYLSKYFTQQGVTTLTELAKTLLLAMVENKTYPLNLGLIIGLPYFKAYDNVQSEQDLKSRLNQILMLLGRRELQVTDSLNRIYTYSLGEN